MTYAPTILEPDHPDYHPVIDPHMNELLRRISPRQHLSNLPELLNDVVVELVMALYGDGRRDKDSPAMTAEVIGYVDEALGVLHEIRTRAIGENRRRMDVAMERTAYLEGDAR